MIKMEIRKYSIGQFARLINHTEQTLRNWDKSGKLKPAYVDEETSYRHYTDEQLRLYNGEKTRDKQVIGYCRVSNAKQKDALNRQIENVKSYMYAKGYQFSVISDIESGINYNNKGLNKLIDMVLKEEVSKIVVLYNGRLVRFGFELIENICNSKGVSIEIIDTMNHRDLNPKRRVPFRFSIITINLLWKTAIFSLKKSVKSECLIKTDCQEKDTKKIR